MHQQPKCECVRTLHLLKNSKYEAREETYILKITGSCLNLSKKSVSITPACNNSNNAEDSCKKNPLTCCENNVLELP